MTTRTLLLPGRRSDSFYAWAETLRVVKWNPSRAARDISLFFRSNFPVRLFQIPCSVILNSLLFQNRELPANYLTYRGLPRQETAGSAQKWPEFPVFPCYSWLPAETGSLQPAPSATQSGQLWHWLQEREREFVGTGDSCAGRARRPRCSPGRDAGRSLRPRPDAAESSKSTSRAGPRRRPSLPPCALHVRARARRVPLCFVRAPAGPAGRKGCGQRQAPTANTRGSPPQIDVTFHVNGGVGPS